ncbi:MAG: hypothetical protein RLW61_07795 [Gammaproteobacteria bacterium]
MNPFNSDRFIAAIFCVSATVAFAASQPVAHAATAFPPAHLDARAVFAAPSGLPARVSRGPWYRPSPETGDAGEHAIRGGAPFAAEITVTPWYRAAN